MMDLWDCFPNQGRQCQRKTETSTARQNAFDASSGHMCRQGQGSRHLVPCKRPWATDLFGLNLPWGLEHQIRPKKGWRQGNSRRRKVDLLHFPKGQSPKQVQTGLPPKPLCLGNLQLEFLRVVLPPHIQPQLLC